MVGGDTGKGVIQPRFRGWRILPWGRVVGVRGVDGVGYVTGIHQPLKRGWDTSTRNASYHVMAGYAYVNPLAG